MHAISHQTYFSFPPGSPSPLPNAHAEKYGWLARLTARYIPGTRVYRAHSAYARHGRPGIPELDAATQRPPPICNHSVHVTGKKIHEPLPLMRALCAPVYTLYNAYQLRQGSIAVGRQRLDIITLVAVSRTQGLSVSSVKAAVAASKTRAATSWISFPSPPLAGSNKER